MLATANLCRSLESFGKSSEHLFFATYYFCVISTQQVTRGAYFQLFLPWNSFQNILTSGLEVYNRLFIDSLAIMGVGKIKKHQLGLSQ